MRLLKCSCIFYTKELEMVIYYEDYAKKLLKIEHKQAKTLGAIDDKLWNMINKIFEWDRKLNLIKE